ncbi:MAG: nuclear transport factor 2 family protein [Pseudomonadota bacterium]
MSEESATATAALLARIDGLERRLGELEDVSAIRRLHFAYGYYIDLCQYDEVVDLFARDGEAIFLSGIYRGHAGVARLYKTWFQEFFTHGKPGPEYGFLLDHFQMQDIITVAPDRQSAKGRFRCLLAGGTHNSREYQPEGLPAQFYEAGIYENDYVVEDGAWKIKRLDYMVQWQADYDKGWHHTVAHLQPQVIAFPENPLGPDELLPEQRQTWPHRSPVPQHYAHPVLAPRGGG